MPEAINAEGVANFSPGLERTRQPWDLKIKGC